MKRSAVILTALLALVLFLSACQPAAVTEVPQPAAASTNTTAPTEAAAPTSTTAPTDTVEPTAAPVETEAAPAAEGISLTDSLGNNVTLDGPAQRIISLAPSNTEILYATGAGDQVVARDDFSNYPEEAASLPTVGGNFTNYNLEEMAKAEPDLILASPLNTPEQVKEFQAITPNVYMLANPTDLDGLFANLVIVGELTGHKAEAEELAESLRARAQAVTDKVATATDKPVVFYELDATDPAKPWTAGPGTFIDLLIGLAGGENIGAQLTGDYAQISQEELLVQNPDFILLGDSLYGGITPESVAARPGWEQLDAVKNGQVLAFNDDLVSRPGPRMIDGLEEIAKILHPDLFK